MAYSIGSDAVHGFPCTLCTADNINRDSAVFCVECNQYLCQQCLRSHNRFPDLERHQTVGREHFPPVGQTPRPRLRGNVLQDKCRAHLGNLIEIYCETHDEVCCSTCVALRHSNCQKEYIPDIASSQLSSGSSIRSVTQKLTTLHGDFQNMKQTKVAHQQRLGNEKTASLQMTQDRRRDINAYFDKLEAKFNSKVKVKHDDFYDILEADVKTCDETMALLDASETSVQSSTTDPQKFVTLKLAEWAIKEAKNKQKQCLESTTDLITFAMAAPSSDVNEDLFPRSSFGALHGGLLPPKYLRPEGDFNIDLVAPNNTCYCSSMCQLSNGTVVLTDHVNKVVHAFKYNKYGKCYTPLSSLKIDGDPFCVCVTGDNEVAVGLKRGMRALFMTVSPNLTINRSCLIGQDCYKMAFYRSTIYTGHYHGYIECTSIPSGTFQKKFFTADTDQNFHFEFCILPEEEHVIVTHGCHGLLRLSLDGDLITKYSVPRIGFIRCICFDEEKNLYIADTDTKSIRVVGVDKTARTVVRDLGAKPTALCYDRKTNRLLVATENSNHIQSYSLRHS